MNLKEELEEAKKKRAELVARINQLDQERQNLLAEALKIEGELRILLRIEKETKDA